MYCIVSLVGKALANTVSSSKWNCRIGIGFLCENEDFGRWECIEIREKWKHHSFLSYATRSRVQSSVVSAVKEKGRKPPAIFSRETLKKGNKLLASKTMWLFVVVVVPKPAMVLFIFVIRLKLELIYTTSIIEVLAQYLLELEWNFHGSSSRSIT